MLQGALLRKCPLCDVGMKVVRRISRGRKAGQSFIGCSRYPFCKYFMQEKKATQNKTVGVSVAPARVAQSKNQRECDEGTFAPRGP